VCTEFIEGAWVGWYSSIWLHNPDVIKGSRSMNRDKTLWEDWSRGQVVSKKRLVLGVYCGGKCSINERMTAAIMNSDTRNQSTCLHSIAKHILSRFVFGNAKLTATYDSIALRPFTKFLDAAA
jgi:hypothetical protein